MKPSHIRTPRTLDECTFRPEDDPVEGPYGMGYSTTWKVAFVVVCILALFVVSTVGVPS